MPDLAGELLARCDFGVAMPGGGLVVPAVPNGGVALAVSGGADSLALLVLASRAGLDAVAIHVDHGLREGSDTEADVVAAAAARFGLGFESRRVDVEPGPDLEARARRARYDALPAAVMTGHTMDDQAETVLLNTLWGAGLDGLAAIRSGLDGRPRRPLLRIRRAETVALCESVGLTPVQDPSNCDPRFRRNRVRSEVLPLLCDVAGRDVVPVLARQADLLAADAELLDDLASRLDPTDTRVLRDTPLPLARRAIRRWLRSPAAFADDEAHPPSAAEVARVIDVVRGEAEACELAGGRRVRRSSGRLEVQAR
jgi:tRNA(Ile)-lysidine synthase